MLKNKTVIYLYSRYERFWHWLQSLLIIILLLSGFEIHQGFTLFGFHSAVRVHNFVGLAWLIAFAFFVFWILTTGEWKQYIPTTKKMLSVVRYYSWGIFRGEAHPVPKRKEAKHNPLQRLAYLSLAAFFAAVSDDHRLSLLGVQLMVGVGYRQYLPRAPCGVAHLGRVCHFDLSGDPPLHDHHRPQHFRPCQSHDHRLAGGGKRRGRGNVGSGSRAQTVRQIAIS
jgi:thiosulfate reductase cytochrome b subunit